MICINVAEFVLISQLEKVHSMIETHRLKNVIFIQTILSFVLSRKIIDMALCLKKKSVEKRKTVNN